jgi:hypothetical protein
MSEALKRFTIEEANRTLPLVSRIVADLIALHPRWRAAVVAFEAAQVGVTSAEESDESRQLRLEAGHLAGEIEACLDELGQIGCIFKDFEVGLIDFPALHEDRMVYLCWRHGEARIEHWHELDSGFAGRRPLEQDLLPVTSS